MADLFILGAGFSKAIHAHMPTLNELSGEVIGKLRNQSLSIPQASR